MTISFPIEILLRIFIIVGVGWLSFCALDYNGPNEWMSLLILSITVGIIFIVLWV